MIYTDTAHNITYELDDEGYAEMTCRSCDAVFVGQPANTEDHNAPYDGSGRPNCGCR